MAENKLLKHDFCWLDFAADNAETAIKFYEKLFGWKVQVEDNNGSHYYMMNLKEKPVCGIMEITDEMRKMGVPPCWSSYIQVDNLEEILEKVVANNGQVINPPTDIGEPGRWAMIADNCGAYVGLWEPKYMTGFAYKEENGAPCWFELASPDPEASVLFYSNIFGWSTKKENMGNMDYYTMSIEEVTVAGCFKMTPEMEGIPPHWLPYFATDNITDANTFIVNSGGKVLMPITNVEGIGSFTVVQDPQSGAFGIIQP